jgi:hypothetical protein
VGVGVGAVVGAVVGVLAVVVVVVPLQAASSTTRHRTSRHNQALVAIWCKCDYFMAAKFDNYLA